MESPGREQERGREERRDPSAVKLIKPYQCVIILVSELVIIYSCAAVQEIVRKLRRAEKKGEERWTGRRGEQVSVGTAPARLTTNRPNNQPQPTRNFRPPT